MSRDEAMAKIGVAMATDTRDDLIQTLAEDGTTIEYLRALAREYERIRSAAPELLAALKKLTAPVVCFCCLRQKVLGHTVGCMVGDAEALIRIVDLPSETKPTKPQEAP